MHQKRITQGLGTPLLMLFGAAAVLLLIACLNVAGLLAGDAAGRQQEIAVRFALGAGKGRVVRQLLTESALLGVIGAFAGLVVAWLGTSALLSFAPPMPRLNEVGMSVRALLFATVVGVTTGIAFGFAPALGLIGARDVLRSHGVTRPRRGTSLQAGVVLLQLGLHRHAAHRWRSLRPESGSADVSGSRVHAGATRDVCLRRSCHASLER